MLLSAAAKQTDSPTSVRSICFRGGQSKGPTSWDAPGLVSPLVLPLPSPFPPSRPLPHLPWPSGESVQLSKPSGSCARVLAGGGSPAGNQQAPQLVQEKQGEGHSQERGTITALARHIF